HAVPEVEHFSAALRQKKRTSATPAPTSTIPIARPGLMCFASKPTQPKLSTTSDASACPATTRAISVAAPSFGADTIEAATYNAPSAPPSQTHQGASPTRPHEGSGLNTS